MKAKRKMISARLWIDGLFRPYGRRLLFDRLRITGDRDRLWRCRRLLQTHKKMAKRKSIYAVRGRAVVGIRIARPPHACQARRFWCLTGNSRKKMGVPEGVNGWVCEHQVERVIRKRRGK